MKGLNLEEMQSLTQQGFEIKRSTHDDLDLGKMG